MGLFTKKTAPAETSASAVKKSYAAPVDRNLAAVIIGPHITEKAVRLGEGRVYTFKVRRDATKRTVAEAVTAIYNVTPHQVRIVNRAPAKRPKGYQGKAVAVPGLKKAYVYLKAGETINLV
jgi:large subunit ribosomal protein L23